MLNTINAVNASSTRVKIKYSKLCEHGKTGSKNANKLSTMLAFSNYLKINGKIFYNQGRLALLHKIDITMPVLGDEHNKVTLKKIQEYLDLKSKNSKEELFEVYTKEEIKELEKSSEKIVKMMADFQPHLSLARTLATTIKIPDFSSALTPIVGIQNSVSIFKVETKSMLHWMRAADNMFVDLSYQIKSINKIFMNAITPLKWLSEAMQQNANVIKNMARTIEQVNQPTLLKGILEIPQYPLFDALSVLDSHKDNIVQGQNQMPPIESMPKWPVAIEKREIQILTEDGSVYATFSKQNNIDSIEKLNKAYFEVTGQSTNLLATNVSDKKIVITIMDKSQKSIIKATNIGASKPISSKKNGWLAAFRTYIENDSSVHKKHVLQDYYSAKENKGFSGFLKSNKEKTPISQIHYQIREGLKRSFPDLLRYISFEKVSNGYDEGRYLLKIEEFKDSILTNYPEK